MREWFCCIVIFLDLSYAMLAEGTRIIHHCLISTNKYQRYGFLHLNTKSLIPEDLPRYLLDDDFCGILMQYFYGVSQVIDKMAGGQSKLYAQKAFYDTTGGYLKHYIIPATKYSYYAGLIKLKNAENIINLYRHCINALNTNGNGWRDPITDFANHDLRIQPLTIVVHSEEEDTACMQLDLLGKRTGVDTGMIVALPRLDREDRGSLENIWFPFKQKQTFNLRSSISAFVFLRYFELSTRCFHFQRVCQDVFNKKLKNWILENLEVHLVDDVFYPGLGALLRIVETLSLRNKGTIIVTKLNKKRQKTKSYKVLEDNTKQLEKAAENRLDDKSARKNILDDYMVGTDISKNEDGERRWIYICITVFVAFLLLIFVFIFALCLKRKRKQSSPYGTEGESRKAYIQRDIFKRIRPYQNDEDVLLEHQSSSIASYFERKPSLKQTKTRISTKSGQIKSGLEAKEDYLSRKEVIIKEDLLSRNITESRRYSPSKRESNSSSSTQAPKCFALCTKKQNADKTDTSLESDSALQMNRKLEDTEDAFINKRMSNPNNMHS